MLAFVYSMQQKNKPYMRNKQLTNSNIYIQSVKKQITRVKLQFRDDQIIRLFLTEDCF